ncbi:hypothetical protein CYMTET_21068 [Cymbomonas tetramitiformis]|uniref:Uncharacterized protein n=1 Tax=Cymbomonas tetramitiformis TaxID=36881 RepID=A0AAE0G3J3_9CHLO|nr:hypothetical protein CYMTET_21068 [Cymbomonas tetramitiformis]
MLIPGGSARTMLIQGGCGAMLIRETLCEPCSSLGALRGAMLIQGGLCAGHAPSWGLRGAMLIQGAARSHAYQGASRGPCYPGRSARSHAHPGGSAGHAYPGGPAGHAHQGGFARSHAYQGMHGAMLSQGGLCTEPCSSRREGSARSRAALTRIRGTSRNLLPASEGCSGASCHNVRPGLVDDWPCRMGLGTMNAPSAAQGLTDFGSAGADAQLESNWEVMNQGLAVLCQMICHPSGRGRQRLFNLGTTNGVVLMPMLRRLVVLMQPSAYAGERGVATASQETRFAIMRNALLCVHAFATDTDGVYFLNAMQEADRKGVVAGLHLLQQGSGGFSPGLVPTTPALAKLTLQHLTHNCDAAWLHLSAETMQKFTRFNTPVNNSISATYWGSRGM